MLKERQLFRVNVLPHTMYQNKEITMVVSLTICPHDLKTMNVWLNSIQNLRSIFPKGPIVDKKVATIAFLNKFQKSATPMSYKLFNCIWPEVDLQLWTDYIRTNSWLPIGLSVLSWRRLFKQLNSKGQTPCKANRNFETYAKTAISKHWNGGVGSHSKQHSASHYGPQVQVKLGSILRERTEHVYLYGGTEIK